MQRSDLIASSAILCRYSGLNRLCRPFYGGLGLILMFHRFTGNPDKTVDKSGVVSRTFFDNLVGYIKRKGPDIIFLRDLPQTIADRRPFVCLTFDDGYRDNAEIALPILHKYKAPATIFIPSGILDRSLNAWWLQIEEIAKTKPNPRTAYEQMVSEIDRDPAVLQRYSESFAVSQADLNDRYFMNEKEIKTIDNDPLIDIGGHTLTHPLLRTLSEREAFQEIKQNKKDLETLLGHSVETFAYPYGNKKACGLREFRLVKKAGYRTGVTTREGNVFQKHEQSMTALPRYSVRGFLESISIYNMQRDGMYRALKSRLGPAYVTE